MEIHFVQMEKEAALKIIFFVDIRKRQNNKNITHKYTHRQTDKTRPSQVNPVQSGQKSLNKNMDLIWLENEHHHQV